MPSAVPITGVPLPSGKIAALSTSMLGSKLALMSVQDAWVGLAQADSRHALPGQAHAQPSAGGFSRDRARER